MSKDQRRRILVIAYACCPDVGSEPGAGWGVVDALQAHADCTVLVSPDHQTGIEAWQGANPDDTRRFIFVEEPWWARHAKWHRVPWFIAYLAWLRRAAKTARSLVNSNRFDAALHASYSVYWLPSPIAQLGIPSVLGPVGGAVRTPRPLWPLLRPKAAFDESLDLVSVWLASQTPPVRRTWRGVDVILAQNLETKLRIEGRSRHKVEILNHALFTEPPVPLSEPTDGSRPGVVWFSDRGPRPFVWCGRIEARKGPALAIQAIAATPDQRLIVVGDGPERAATTKLAHDLGVADRVQFRGRVERSAAIAMVAESAGLLATGLREEGGIALGEALLLGVPTILVGVGGAKAVAREAGDDQRVTIIEPQSVTETASKLGKAMTATSAARFKSRTPLLDRAEATRRLHEAVDRAIASRMTH